MNRILSNKGRLLVILPFLTIPSYCSPPASDGDQDGDGYSIEEGDCDDYDSSSYPGAEEVPYDGIDQDCDDRDLSDVDGDGYDAEEAGGEDCDDEDPDVYPDAEEERNGIDDSCDGWIDDEGNGKDPNSPYIYDLITWNEEETEYGPQIFFQFEYTDPDGDVTGGYVNEYVDYEFRESSPDLEEAPGLRGTMQISLDWESGLPPNTYFIFGLSLVDIMGHESNILAIPGTTPDW